jgi:protein involved in polysaccharide export with SLBB domain
MPSTHTFRFAPALALGALALTSISPPSQAQGRSSRPVSSAQAAGYKLGPQDAISVTVKDFPEFNVGSTVIPPDGVVSLPYYGSVRASGRTARQIEDQLRRTLLRELKNPRVSVTITNFRPTTIGSVYLVGSVAVQGPIEIREGFRLSEVIAAAGGLGGRLEQKRVTLTRARQAPITLNLGDVVSRPNSAANVRVRPNDVLTISSIRPGVIQISGAVANPGPFELHRNPVSGSRELGLYPRLSTVINAAGGLTRPGAGNGGASDSGDLTSTSASGAAGGTSSTSSTLGVRYEATLQRAGARIELNVQEALRDVSGIYNVPLRAGDFVTVEAILPPPPLRVLVDGFVGRTGSITVPVGTRFLQALTEAGGPTKTADKVVAQVRRGGQIIPVDYQAILLNNSTASNIELQAGDTIEIREPEVIRIRAEGSVGKPGELRVRPNTTLLEALFEAGNLSIKPEDARLSVLRREEDGTQKIVNADAEALLSLSSVKDNLVLREGDLINVSPLRTQTIFVLGEVANPGAFDVREGEGIVELITRAGGAKETAALTRVVIDRGGQNITADAYDAIKQGRPLDLKLQKGDKVVVPENPNRVLVMEAVVRPGPVPIPEKGRLTLSDALAEAGRATPEEQRSDLVRRGAGGTFQERKFPMKDVRSGARRANGAAERRHASTCPRLRPRVGPRQSSAALSIFNILGLR